MQVPGTYFSRSFRTNNCSVLQHQSHNRIKTAPIDTIIVSIPKEWPDFIILLKDNNATAERASRVNWQISGHKFLLIQFSRFALHLSQHYRLEFFHLKLLYTPFDSPYAISYWWSSGTTPVSLTVSEIFNVKCNAMVDVTLIRPLNKGQGHSYWYHCTKMNDLDLCLEVG